MAKKKTAQSFDITNYELVPDTLIWKKTLRNADYLLEMNIDTLLYTFRVNAGLETKGAPLPVGWEAPDTHFRGQFIGHYLTACARSALALRKLLPEKSEQLRTRTEEIVTQLSICQDALAKKEEYPGYLGAVETTMFDDLEQLHFTGIFTVIYYNQHKIMSGLLNTYILLKNKLALQILEKMAAYINFRMSRLSEKRIQQMIETRWYRENTTKFHMEFGGMQELLLKLYQETGKPEHLNLAKKFDRRWFRNMLLGEKDMLGHYSLHANTEIPCVIGLAECEDMFEDEEARKCVDHFMSWIRNGHMFPTGGVSGRPAYTDPADYGGELFEYPHMYWKHMNHNCGESCCSHNLNILAGKEFQWTADGIWAAEYEKRFVNAVLAQQHPETGGFVYNLNLRQGSVKGHSVDGFFCCNGTGVESHSYLTEGAFYKNEDTLWIANYVPCNLNWEEQNVKIEARTDFPVNGKCVWTLRLDKKKFLKINIRIPEWTDPEAKLSINGIPVKTNTLSCGSFLCLERVWENGDRIEADFPFYLKAEHMEDRPEYIAVYYGPHLLVACTEGYAVFDGSTEELLLSMKPTGIPCRFEAEMSSGKVTFMPICDVVDEMYNGYTIITEGTPFRVVDEIVIGETDSEAEHSLLCTQKIAGKDAQGQFLACSYPGQFSFVLRAVKGRQLWLRCYFADRGVLYRYPEEPAVYNQCFRFELSDDNGTDEIAVQALNEKEGEELTAVYYPVMERNGNIKLTVSGSRYEGKKRGTGKFYNKIELGYFE